MNCGRVRLQGCEGELQIPSRSKLSKQSFGSFSFQTILICEAGPSKGLGRLPGEMKQTLPTMDRRPLPGGLGTGGLKLSLGSLAHVPIVEAPAQEAAQADVTVPEAQPKAPVYDPKMFALFNPGFAPNPPLHGLQHHILSAPFP